MKPPSSSQTVLLATSEVSLPSQRKHAKPPVSSGVIGMLIFMVTEAMFFAALISAYMVIRAGLDEWPPWGQPRLPVETTAFNTLLLLASGLLMAYSRALLQKNKILEGRQWLGISILLGTFFLISQGNEWVQLINFGLTVSSSVYGGLFYLIIGAHGFHVNWGADSPDFCLESFGGFTQSNYTRRAIPTPDLLVFRSLCLACSLCVGLSDMKLSSI